MSERRKTSAKADHYSRIPGTGKSRCSAFSSRQVKMTYGNGDDQLHLLFMCICSGMAHLHGNYPCWSDNVWTVIVPVYQTLCLLTLSNTASASKPKRAAIGLILSGLKVPSVSM